MVVHPLQMMRTPSWLNTKWTPSPCNLSDTSFWWDVDQTWHPWCTRNAQLDDCTSKKLKLTDSQIFTLLPMLSMESLTALSLKTKMRSYSISLWHTPFSQLDLTGVNFRSTQGVIHWGSNQVLKTSSASWFMHLPIFPFIPPRKHLFSQIYKDSMTKQAKCAYLMSKHICRCSFVYSHNTKLMTWPGISVDLMSTSIREIVESGISLINMSQCVHRIHSVRNLDFIQDVFTKAPVAMGANLCRYILMIIYYVQGNTSGKIC